LTANSSSAAPIFAAIIATFSNAGFDMSHIVLEMTIIVI
jgi:hypothetical protein